MLVHRFTHLALKKGLQFWCILWIAWKPTTYKLGPVSCSGFINPTVDIFTPPSWPSCNQLTHRPGVALYPAQLWLKGQKRESRAIVLSEVYADLYPSPSVYLSIYLYILPSIHPSIHPSIYMFIHQSIHPSIDPSTHPSIRIRIRIRIHVRVRTRIRM